MKKWFGVASVVLFAALAVAQFMQPQKGNCMALDFNGSSDYVRFPATGGYAELSQLSILAWVNLDAITSGGDGIINKMAYPYTGWDFAVQNYPAIGRTNQLQFWYAWSGPAGKLAGWAANNVMSTGSTLHVAVTYDRTSTSNDPALYVNGESKTVTELFAPSGSPITDTDTMDIGVSGYWLDGRVYDVLVYNRVLSAAEIAEAYNTRLYIPTYQGLVFAPTLCGASGLQNFDGVSLGASNKIIDLVSGASGTPAGAPVGRADNLLIWR